MFAIPVCRHASTLLAGLAEQNSAFKDSDHERYVESRSLPVDEQDPFEGITFDDSWVAGASMTEAAAASRALTRTPTPILMDEPPSPGKRSPLKAAGALIALAVGTGLTLLVLHDRATAQPSAPLLSATATPEPTPTSSLNGFNTETAQVGTCLSWDPDDRSSTVQVPCSQLHRDEITA